MKSFKEFLEDSKDIIYQRIINHPQVVIKSKPEQSLDGGEWMFKDSSLNVMVIISKEYLNKAYEKLSADDFEKDFFDKNVGLIPHELLEGYLTGVIMIKRYDQIPDKFVQAFSYFRSDFEKLFNKYQFDSSNIHREEKAYDAFGGYVHEMIVRSIPEYKSWLNYITDQII
jgi:hypothetical protein